MNVVSNRLSMEQCKASHPWVTHIQTVMSGRNGRMNRWMAEQMDGRQRTGHEVGSGSCMGKLEGGLDQNTLYTLLIISFKINIF